MSSLRDVWDFERHNFGTIWEKIKKNPERILYGSIEPFSTELWNQILGEDHEPMINQLGGPMGSGWAGLSENGGVYESAQAKGIDTQFSEQSHDVAEIIAGIFGAYGAGGAFGGGGGGAAAGGGGGTAGTAGTGATAGTAGGGGISGAGLGGAAVGGESAATLAPVVVSGSSGGGGAAIGAGGAAGLGAGLALDSSGGLVAEGTPGSTPLESGNQAYTTSGGLGSGGGNWFSQIGEALQGAGGAGGGGGGGGGSEPYQHPPMYGQQQQITPIAPTNPNVNSSPKRGLGAATQIDPQLLAMITRQLARRPVSGGFV